jgi:hypothetical protein
LCVNGNLWEFLGGTTRVFELNDKSIDSAVVKN